MLKTVSLAIIAATVTFAAPAVAQVTQTYTYDANGRLIAVATATSTGGVTTGYDLDDANNRDIREAYGTTLSSVAWTMSNDQSLVTSQKMVSQDGRFRLELQQDGNLVLYFGSTPLWATNTPSGRQLYFRVQGDGNAVLYDVEFDPVWASNTASYPGATLTLQNDGNLVLRDTGGTIRWQSNTCCH
ncbi:hypothetical protein [Brevundimonas sp. A19_0]|uniref:hypothetical protein n=1 Tax=Brevundimonas sp. A19_0 TaxID=2821087 RepID=UPI001ADB1245|nr:hypothetical protein [Brevundimonas sp. A19_0]MBO9500887.1 hypothetical protein [Brevundimonas sp. A19_0]